MTMSEVERKGYILFGSVVLDKSGTEVDLSRYKCVSCKLVLRKPLQLLCGDRICSPCLPSPSKKFLCKFCDELIDPSVKSPRQYFQDRRCQDDIQKFKVVCKCNWTGSLEDFELHVETCPVLGMVTATTNLAPTKFSSPVPADEILELRRAVTSLERRYSDLAVTSREETQPIRGSLVAGGYREEVNLKETVTKLMADMAQVKESLKHLNEMIEQVSRALPRYESLLDELNLKVEILEVKATNGEYVWKINEVKRRSREARTGKTTSLYSPPFYTDVHGYRICLRVYLFGDGIGKGTHISLFLVLMRSEYDDILPWPFHYYVTLSLLNLDNPGDPSLTIVHKFKTSKDSDSFSKPQDTFNLASGFPQFAGIDVLDDPAFVKNDTMFFKVTLEPIKEDMSAVDNIDLSKFGKSLKKKS